MATTTFKVVDFYRNNINSNDLGFNVTGGYSSDIPATIFDIKSSSNEKLMRVLKKNTIFKSNIYFINLFYSLKRVMLF